MTEKDYSLKFIALFWRGKDELTPLKSSIDDPRQRVEMKVFDDRESNHEVAVGWSGRFCQWLIIVLHLGW
jgi:hypothetical protein